MTYEILKMAGLIKGDIERHKEALNTLQNYRANIKQNQNAILRYFSERPLYDVSLHFDIENKMKNMLDREIVACERIISLKEKEFEQL